MTRLSLDLSGGLTNLAADFDQFVNGGLILDGEAVARLVAHLRKLKLRARELENEVSASRWNKAAREDRAREARAILAEAVRPGSNVTLFPVIARPFSDGHPRGAA
jgi:hypothetical protein